MATVTGKMKAGGKGKGKPKHVHIEFAPGGAGGMVNHSREAADGTVTHHGPIPFVKKAPMMKHVSSLADEAMPTSPSGTDLADASMDANQAGGEGGAGAAPVATNP